ncbi:MAG: TIGR00730 family Rossman fold protein [Hyphomicrobiaceae bacterium]|nr:TIGR00730 family Rossman fold protein [Hyphomicrobiaceae bacterium]
MNTIHSSPPGHTSIRNICVFCGSGPGRNPAYEAAANVLGRAMAAAGIGLVYGGGSLGLMGVVARSVLGAGGRVTGIIPSFLSDREMMLRDVDELIVTEDMHQRKRLMFDRSDAFVALPGGIGTLEELVEQLTWEQLGQHKKPIVLASIDGFWSPLVALLDHMRSEAFIRPDLDVRYTIVHTAEAIVPAVLGVGASSAPASVDGARDIIPKL